MGESLIFISGASSGIGDALARSVPWTPARVVGISRSRPVAADKHVAADLADPSAWDVVGAAFEREVADFAGGSAGDHTGDHIVFVHAAGTIEPMGFAGEVDPEAYTANVLLDSAAAQVLGHRFLAAVRGRSAHRHLVMLTSGAAKSVYPGWSSYGAAKAAVDQWVRDVGAEQSIRGGVQVLAVAPGTVDTGMQALLRATPADDFPQRQKFLDLHADGKLADPDDVARDIWSLLDRGLDNGSVVDLRDLARSDT